MASGMKAAGAYPTTNTTAAAVNEAVIAAADPAAIVMADSARAGRHISSTSMAASEYHLRLSVSSFVHGKSNSVDLKNLMSSMMLLICQKSCFQP